MPGKRVLVTRPIRQADKFITLLRQIGAIPHCLPCITIDVADDPGDHYIDNALECNLLIFTSANAVDFLLQRRPAPWAARQSMSKIAAIGNTTAARLAAHGFPVDYLPAQAKGSEQLFDLLKQTTSLKNQRITIVRGNSGREKLRDDLSLAGAKVTYLEVYKRSLPSISSEEARQTFVNASPNVISITSDLGLENLYRLLPVDCHATLFDTPLIVNSVRCHTLAKTLGFQGPLIVADPPGDVAQVKAIGNFFDAGSTSRQ